MTRKTKTTTKATKPARRTVSKAIETKTTAPTTKTATTADKVAKTTTTGLSETEATALLKIEENINTLYEKRNKILASVAKRTGTMEVVLKTDDADQPYRRVKVVDQLEEFSSGKPVYRNTAITRFSAVITKLKNAPKTEKATV